jgi:hypothetical protein
MPDAFTVSTLNFRRIWRASTAPLPMLASALSAARGHLTEGMNGAISNAHRSNPSTRVTYDPIRSTTLSQSAPRRPAHCSRSRNERLATRGSGRRPSFEGPTGPFPVAAALPPLPLGRLRLATRPTCAGSAPTANRIGKLVVAAFAGRVGGRQADNRGHSSLDPIEPPAGRREAEGDEVIAVARFEAMGG